MQAPGGPEEDTAARFEHGGWSFGYWDEAMGQWMGDTMGKPFALLLGRKTSRSSRHTGRTPAISPAPRSSTRRRSTSLPERS
jgi:hypothetical protein